MKSINPTTNALINEYEPHSNDAVRHIIDQADQAFLSWRKKPVTQRSEILICLAQALRDNSESYSQLITREMGKPIKQAQAEIEKCAWLAEYYAHSGPELLSNQHIKTEVDKSYISFQPMGVILAIMPWNFPFWQVIRFAVPTLLAGNTVILKHASNVSGCSLALQELFAKAGFDPYVFNSVLIDSSQVEAVIKSDVIKAVTLTGSTQAGRSVAKIAGECLKKTVLELGGSDAYIVLNDANLEKTVKLCAQSRLLNNGQSCIAAKRFIVIASIHDCFVQLMQQEFEQQLLGDPADPHTNLGPMARVDLRDELHEQVRNCIQQGAKCIAGGEVPDQVGAFYPATLLTNIKPGMPGYDDELFGPVASVIKAKDIDDAIRIANDTQFGLGAAIFTNNLVLAERLAEQEIQAGSVFVNDFVKSDPRLPFGGIKSSGYGREMGSFGIHEFVNIKTISISK